MILEQMFYSNKSRRAEMCQRPNSFAVLIVDRPIDLVQANGINAACLPACRNMFDYKFKNGTGTRCLVFKIIYIFFDIYYTQMHKLIMQMKLVSTTLQCPKTLHRGGIRTNDLDTKDTS
jgi:hypothetical protein